MLDNLVKKISEIYKDEYNVFRILKNGDHEIRHSSFLAWLLDPKGSHGFGNEFAIKFLTLCMAGNRGILPSCGIKDNSIKNFDAEYWKKVYSDENDDIMIFEEYPVPMNAGIKYTDKRIDILIVGKSFTCTIENKYGSIVHDDQLQRYRRFVEGSDHKSFLDFKYPRKINHFVFLDIPVYEKVSDYLKSVHRNKKNPDEKKTDEFIRKTYEGYNYISYEDVILFLSDLCNEKYKGKSRDQYEFINQYIELVNEKYGIFSKKISSGCNNLINEYKKLSDSDLETINLDNPKYKDTLSRFRDYTRSIQSDNDEFIKNRLKDLFIHEDLIQMHYGKADTTNPYAFKYTLDKNIHPEISNYFGQIDFPAKYGRYSMALYCGVTSNNVSRNWVKYFLDNSDQVNEKIKKMSSPEWECFLEYRIYASTGQGLNLLKEIKELGYDLRIELKDVSILKKCNSNYLGTILKEQLFENGKLKNDFCDMLKTIFPEYYLDLINAITTSFSEDRKQMTCRWNLCLVRHFDELNNGKAIISDMDREAIKGILCDKYKDAISTGLEFFNLDDGNLYK